MWFSIGKDVFTRNDERLTCETVEGAKKVANQYNHLEKKCEYLQDLVDYIPDDAERTYEI